MPKSALILYGFSMRELMIDGLLGYKSGKAYISWNIARPETKLYMVNYLYFVYFICIGENHERYNHKGVHGDPRRPESHW